MNELVGYELYMSFLNGQKTITELASICEAKSCNLRHLIRQAKYYINSFCSQREIEEIYRKEEKVVFDMFMDYFDCKNDLRGLVLLSDNWEKEHSVLANSLTLILGSDIYHFSSSYGYRLFIEKWSTYAKAHGIEDLRKKVVSKPYFKKCFDMLMSFLNGEVSKKDYVFAKLALPQGLFLEQAITYARDIEGYREAQINKLKLGEYIVLYKNVVEKLESTREIKPASEKNKAVLDILTEYGEYNIHGISVGNKILEDLSEHVSYPEQKMIAKVSRGYSSCLNKLHKVAKSKQAELERQEKIDKGYQIINNFIENNKPLSDYLKAAGVTSGVFQKALKNVQETNPELYGKYLLHMESLKRKRYFLVRTTMNKVMDGIKEKTFNKGVFTALDYYSLTSISPIRFLELAKEIYSERDYSLAFHYFCNGNMSQYYQLKPAFIDNPYSIWKTNYNIKGNELSYEGKKKIVAYLKSLGAPVNETTFSYALVRFSRGEIPDEIEESKTEEVITPEDAAIIASISDPSQGDDDSSNAIVIESDSTKGSKK